MDKIIALFSMSKIKDALKNNELLEQIVSLLIALALLLVGMEFELLSILGCLILIYLAFIRKYNNGGEGIKVLSLTMLYFFFVYSTYLGRDNWLGSRFYNVFIDKMQFIPLEWVLLLFSVVFLGIIYLFVKQYISKKQWLFVFLGTCVFVLFTWYPLSFISYYSGVESRLSSVGNLLYATTNNVLHSEKDSSTKEKILNDIYKGVSLRAKLQKNGKIIAETNAVRMLMENPGEYNVIYRQMPQIVIGDDTYSLTYSNSYRPDFWRGFFRALTWSVCPDLFVDNAFLEEQGIKVAGNYIYRARRKAGRSMNWWLIFSITYGLACATLCLYKKREIELMQKIHEKNEELEKQYQNTGLYQELLFTQLSSEFNDIIVSQVKSHLQQFTGELGKKHQEVYSPSGEKNAINEIQTNIGDAIHSLKNKWNNEAVKDDNFRIIKVILADLKELEKVFDLSYTNTSIAEVEEIVKSAIPSSYSKTRSLNFSLIPLKQEADNENLNVSINQWRLKSIIKNLLQNSNNAMNKFRRNLPAENRRKYKSQLILETNKEIRDGKKYYIISVKDNGGGFPEDIIDKIYREPIKSSDVSMGERDGSGTVYIGTFIKRMKGNIEVENVMWEDGEKGAHTKIYIPIK